MTQDFVEQTGVTFPVVFDEDDTYNDYDRQESTAPYPLDVIVDEEGVIRYVAAEYDAEAMHRVLEDLLGE